MQTEAACVSSRPGPDFVFCRMGSQQSLWIKSRSWGGSPGHRDVTAETVQTRGVRRKGTQRREFGSDDRASCLGVHVG